MSSSTHPDQNNWYSNNDPALDWVEPVDPSGIAGYSTLLDQSNSSIPNEVVDTTNTTTFYTDKADGTWYFHIRAQDNVGNWSNTTHFKVSIDTETPLTTATIDGTLSTNNYYITQPTVSLNATDTHSGVLTVEYSFDGVIWNQYASPITNLNEGESTVYYRSTDKASNVEAAKQTAPIKVDTVKPTDVTNLNATVNTSNQVILSWVASTDATSGIKEYAIERSTDNTTFTEIARVTSVTYTDYVLTEGTYYYRVKAIDNASNESSYAFANTTVTNLLKNASFEIDDNADNIPDNWTPIIMSAGDGRSADYAKDGAYSLKLVGDTAKQKQVKQNIAINGNAGDVLVLTGENKTVGAASNGGYILGIIYLTYTDGTESSHPILFNKDTHDWTKKSIAITATKNYASARLYVGYYNQTGTAYFDDFKLSKAINMANTLLNPSFETDADSNNVPDDWTPIIMSPGDGRSADFAKEGSYSLKLVGDTAKQKQIRQNLAISGNAGDTLVFTGENKTIGTSAFGGYVGAVVYLTYTDGTESSHQILFNKDSHDWSKKSVAITAQKAFASARLYIVYYNQTGIAYFDDFRLLK